MIYYEYPLSERVRTWLRLEDLFDKTRFFIAGKDARQHHAALLSVFVFALGNPELAPWLTGYLGLFLMGAAFIAIGLFYSSLTENQIVAAILTMMTLLLFLLLSWVSSLGSGAAWTKVVSYLSFSEHFEDLTRGIIDTKDLVYYLSVSFFGLFLAHSVLQSRRWR